MQPENNPIPPAPVLEDENLPKPPKLKKPRKGLMITVVVVLALALAGAAGWFFLLRNSSEPVQQDQAQTTENEDTTNDVPDTQNTETFTSDVYRIVFKYPKTWTVTEDDDESLLIQSQDFAYKTATGESKRGNFRVSIRKGATTADSDIIAKGVAIEPSQKLTYTSPTAAQRTETNLSNFGIGENNNFAFLLITSNFDLKTGDTLGPGFGKETDAFLIGGGYSESSLKPGMATNQVPVTGFNTTNAYKQALAIIQSLQIN
jgi:hypothetical protein